MGGGLENVWHKTHLGTERQKFFQRFHSSLKARLPKIPEAEEESLIQPDAANKKKE